MYQVVILIFNFVSKVLILKDWFWSLLIWRLGVNCIVLLRRQFLIILLLCSRVLNQHLIAEAHRR